MVTVALRRIETAERGSLVGVLDDCGVELLPNTAGCFTARDAITTAHLAREAFGTDWVKVEVIGDERTLLPDGPALLAACEQLVADGLRGAALHDRRPRARAAPGGRRLRRGDAARVADRLGDGDPQPLQPDADHRRAPVCR